MFGFSPYNYERYTRDLLLKDMAAGKAPGGPEPGDRALDFEGRTLDGDRIQLRDYRGDKTWYSPSAPPPAP